MSAGEVENLLSAEESEANISSWSYDMEGHAKKCVERQCKLANKSTQQFHSRNSTFRKSRNCRRFRRFRTQKSNLAPSFSFFTRLYFTWRKVFSTVRSLRCEPSNLENIFVSVTLQAAVILGRHYMENPRFTKNQLLKSVKQLFQVTEKLFKDQTEISGLTTIDYKELTWRSTTPLCDRAIEIMKSQTFVFSDSMPCLGSINPDSVQAWKDKVTWYLETCYLKELDRIDGEPMEFEWKISQDLQQWHSRRRSKKFDWITVWTWALQWRIIFMSMYNDIFGENQEIMKIAWRIPCMLHHMQNSSRTNVGHIWDLVVRKSGMELTSTSQMVTGTELLRSWWSILLKAGILYLKPRVSLEEENWKVKVVERSPFHNKGSEETIELILRTVYGTVADLCNEFDPDHTVSEICESLVIPPKLTPHLRAQHHRHRKTCWKIVSRISKNFLKIRNCPNFAKMPVSQRRLKKDSFSSQLSKDLR